MREYRQLTEENRIEIYAMKQAGWVQNDVTSPCIDADDPMLVTQDIISDSELACRKHIIFLARILKGSGLPEQAINV